MKRVSFNVAKAIKNAGYPQLNTKQRYTVDGVFIYCTNLDTVHNTQYDAPTYLDVWLWLWREKGIRFDIEDLWDTELSYPERGCASNTNQLGGICTPEVSDPEEAVVSAIEYLVENNLIK